MPLGIKIPRNAIKQGAKNAKKGFGDNLQLENGKYSGAVVRIKGVSTSKGDQVVANIKMGGEGLEEDQVGGEIALWFSLEENRIHHMFKFFALLGYEINEDTTPKEIDEAADEIMGDKPVILVSAKASGDNINYRAERLLEDESYDDLFGDEDESEEEDEAEEEDDEVEEEDGEEEDDDGLDDMSRKELKKYIKENDLDIKVLTKHTDDDIRNNIRNA